MSFREELERRKVFRVGAAYLIVAWIIAQIVDVLGNPLQLPGWFDTVVVLLLAVGFPIALLLAWAYELTPSGIQRTQPASSARARQRISGQTLNYIVTALLVLAMIVIGLDVYVLRPSQSDRLALSSTVPELEFIDARVEAIGDSFVDSRNERKTDRPATASGQPILILPFEDLSPDPENGFVAIGLHEEFVNEISRLESFRVIRRETALDLGDDSRPITGIARELGVSAVLRGVVSYAGERIALSVRLVDGRTGETLWAQRYHRSFADVFDLRGEVIRSMATTLGIGVSPAEHAHLSTRSSKSPAAYELYLRALATFHAGSSAEGLELLNRALAVDPNLACAFARKAEYYALEGDSARHHGTLDAEQVPLALAQQNAERALELDPESGRAWYVRGLVHERHWRWREARSDFERAFDLGYLDRGEYAMLLVHSGALERAEQMARERVALNPRHAAAHAASGYVLARVGLLDEALGAYETAAEIAPLDPAIRGAIATVRLRLGDAAEAEQALKQATKLLGDKRRAQDAPWLAYLYARLGRVEDAQRLAQEYDAWAKANPTEPDRRIWVYLALDDRDRALAWLEASLADIAARNPSGDLATVMALRDNFPASAVLDEPEFVVLRRRLAALLED